MKNDLLFPDGIIINRFCKISNLRPHQVLDALNKKYSGSFSHFTESITHKQVIFLINYFFGNENEYRNKFKERLELIDKNIIKANRKLLFEKFKKELTNNTILYPYYEPIFSPFFIHNLPLKTKFHLSYCKGGSDSDASTKIYYESIVGKYKFRKMIVNISAYSAQPFYIYSEYKENKEHYIGQEQYIEQELGKQLYVCRLKNLEFINYENLFDNYCDFNTNLIDLVKYEDTITNLKKQLDLLSESIKEEDFIFIKGTVNYPLQNYFNIYEMMKLRQIVPMTYD